ncbi:ATP-binding cassette domain-containing protein [bacterium]|nr:ATP-binding cassette domain-containing protein [bacterium]
MGQGEPIIRVRDLTVVYGEDVVLEDVSLDIYPGEILVVLGGSGCGKSTLMRHIIGLEQPRRGEVWFGDTNIVTASQAEYDAITRNIGVLFQGGALLKSMTLGANVAMPLQEYTNLSRQMIRDLVQIKLGMVGLANRGRLMPAEMSGGMQKRGALARAMALDPDILFFDEPSAGLDPITAVELDELILAINQSLHTTMFLVTHELASIFKIGGRVVMLDKAEHGIIAEGSPEELQESDDPRVRAFFRRERLKESGS